MSHRAIVAAVILAGTVAIGTGAAAQPILIDPTLHADTVATGLEAPTSMAFVGPDDILVLQKNNGRVRRILGGVLQPDPVLDVAVDNESERGLLGIAVNTAAAGVFLYYTEINDRTATASRTAAHRRQSRLSLHLERGARAARESPARPRSAGHRGSEPQWRRPPCSPTPTPGPQPPVGDGSPLYAVIGD
jgi:glucose/arabinose dehydrogenase